MRTFLAILLLALSACHAHAAEPPAFPLWDGQESVEQYAKRAKVEPAQTLDLGNGIKMEMVLIPAGKFTMGTPEPEPVDEAAFQQKIIIGQAVLAVGGGVLLVFLAVIVIRAIRKRQRPQYSLACFVAMIVAAGVGLGGGTHWWESARAFAEAKAEYQAADVRFEVLPELEKPAHEVTLTKPFYLGKFEVTQEQYQQVQGTNPSRFRGPDLPVEMVSWDDAQGFCKRASGTMGLVVCLPSEAEWEFACRAGTRTTYYTGNSVADLFTAAWCYGTSKETTHPVGKKIPNAWGLYDMHGNVFEWCADLLVAYQGKVPPLLTTRVFRGGSWGQDFNYCRSACRSGTEPERSDDELGFRVVVEVPPKAP